MTYRIEILPGARRELARLPLKDRQRVDARIVSLADEPFPHGSKQIKGHVDQHRVRVGDYRVIYEVRRAVLVVLIVRIGHRRDVYRRL